MKAERKARAGLSRTIKLRLYPSADQTARINCTIGTIRYVWNSIWLPMPQEAQRARREHAERNGSTAEAWKEAWRLHPDPSETAYNRARIGASSDGSGREWIGEALLAPLTRASRNFAFAVKANRGRTQSGAARKVRAGCVRPRSRRDDVREGLEWQLQGKAPLGGVNLAGVINHDQGAVSVPVLFAVPFSDKCSLLRRYIAADVEACELTVKRDGKDYYACIAVRGLQPCAAATIKKGVRIETSNRARRAVALAEKIPNEALKRLRQSRIPDVALVLIELPRRKQSARRHEHLVQLVDH